MSSPLEKLRQIEVLTLALLQHGLAFKKALQKLVGLYVHPFMHRRECMCVFHHIYQYMDNVPEQGVHRIPQHIRDELLTAAVLLPLASCSARWPVSVQIAATDASSTRGVVLRALFPKPWQRPFTVLVRNAGNIPGWIGIILVWTPQQTWSLRPLL